MIKHMVCTNLIEKTDECREAAKKLFLSLGDNISCIKNIRVEDDILHAPDSFDLVLIVDFENMDDLISYANHPYHAEYIMTEMEKYTTGTRLIDYEC